MCTVEWTAIKMETKGKCADTFAAVRQLWLEQNTPLLERPLKLPAPTLLPPHLGKRRGTDVTHCSGNWDGHRPYQSGRTQGNCHSGRLSEQQPAPYSMKERRWENWISAKETYSSLQGNTGNQRRSHTKKLNIGILFCNIFAYYNICLYLRIWMTMPAWTQEVSKSLLHI